MTAQGKITTANAAKSVSAGTPIRVLLAMEDAERLAAAGVTRNPGLVPATRKTGVETLALLEVETRITQSNGWSGRAMRGYRFRTSRGWTLWLSPTQTLILAPEDGLAVKRAHAEALDMARDLAELETRDLETLVRFHRAAREDGNAYAMDLIKRAIDTVQKALEGESQARAVTPSVFPDAPPVRSYADGSQELGPYAERGTAQREDREVAPSDPFLSPIERPEQDPMPVTDHMLRQVVGLVDGGTVFELHPDGQWRSRERAVELMISTADLNWAIERAKRHGLVRQMGGSGRYVANPTLAPAPVHQAVATGRGHRPLCRTQAHHHGPTRLRMARQAGKVTCSRCIDVAAQARREAAELAARIEARGIRPEAVVTIHRGDQRWVVVQTQGDMVQVAPILTEEDREAIEAAGGKIRESQWVPWDLLHVVPAER